MPTITITIKNANNYKNNTIERICAPKIEFQTSVFITTTTTAAVAPHTATPHLLRAKRKNPVRNNITRHTSHITHHTSHVTRHTSHVTPADSNAAAFPQQRQCACKWLKVGGRGLGFRVSGLGFVVYGLWFSAEAVGWQLVHVKGRHLCR